MESQPQNPEFRNNLENFHPCGKSILVCIGTFSTKNEPNTSSLQKLIKKIQF